MKRQAPSVSNSLDTRLLSLIWIAVRYFDDKNRKREERRWKGGRRRRKW